MRVKEATSKGYTEISWGGVRGSGNAEFKNEERSSDER